MGAHGTHLLVKYWLVWGSRLLYTLPAGVTVEVVWMESFTLVFDMPVFNDWARVIVWRKTCIVVTLQ